MDIEVGDRVFVKSAEGKGFVSYVGCTQFAGGFWYGVVLDEPKGKNDGSVNGVRYFNSLDCHGIFVRRSNLSKVETSPLFGNYSASSGGVVAVLKSDPTGLMDKYRGFAGVNLEEDSTMNRSKKVRRLKEELRFLERKLRITEKKLDDEQNVSKNQRELLKLVYERLVIQEETENELAAAKNKMVAYLAQIKFLCKTKERLQKHVDNLTSAATKCAVEKHVLKELLKRTKQELDVTKEENSKLQKQLAIERFSHRYADLRQQPDERGSEEEETSVICRPQFTQGKFNPRYEMNEKNKVSEWLYCQHEDNRSAQGDFDEQQSSSPNAVVIPITSELWANDGAESLNHFPTSNCKPMICERAKSSNSLELLVAKSSFSAVPNKLKCFESQMCTNLFWRFFVQLDIDFKVQDEVMAKIEMISFRHLSASVLGRMQIFGKQSSIRFIIPINTQFKDTVDLLSVLDFQTPPSSRDDVILPLMDQKKLDQSQSTISADEAPCRYYDLHRGRDSLSINGPLRVWRMYYEQDPRPPPTLIDSTVNKVLKRAKHDVMKVTKTSPPSLSSGSSSSYTSRGDAQRGTLSQGEPIVRSEFSLLRKSALRPLQKLFRTDELMNVLDNFLGMLWG